MLYNERKERIVELIHARKKMAESCHEIQLPRGALETLEDGKTLVSQRRAG